jgi:hypothetical protein
MTRLLKPDFFIVGAPKCGTTSLNAYLAAHPAIFMAKKEQHFFGSDLADVWPQPSADEYFASFSGSEWATRRGEASGWYLRSRVAAEEIDAYDPCAQIIVILRNPIEMLPSYHSQLLWDRQETIRDLEQALSAESDRREGRRIPPVNRDNPWRLLYRDVACFHEQVERYLSVFGHDRVCVLLFDDLVGRPAETYKLVLDFLGVDSTFSPDFVVMNPNKSLRSHRVRRAVGALRHPSLRARRIGRRLMPVHPLRSAVVRHLDSTLMRMNTRTAPRPPVDPELSSRLAAEFASDIRQLSALLGRDLTHWCGSTGAAGKSPSA